MFVQWLQSQNKRHWTVKYTKNYAIKYGHILDTGDASALSTLTPCNRQHAMAALASLARYTGRYPEWQQIRQRYGLKWSSGEEASLQAFDRFFSADQSLEAIISKVRAMIAVLPSVMGSMIIYACITGLRCSEAVESVKLLNSGDMKFHITGNYYNPELQLVQHWRFPSIFWRTTKKAYVSYLSRDNYHWIKDLSPKTPTLNAIRLTCRRRGLNMNMHLTRKVFASWLIKEGIDSATVDMLQGRCAQSVLLRHYQSPQRDLGDRVLEAANKLKNEFIL